MCFPRTTHTLTSIILILFPFVWCRGGDYIKCHNCRNKLKLFLTLIVHFLMMRPVILLFIYNLISASIWEKSTSCRLLFTLLSSKQKRHSPGNMNFECWQQLAKWCPLPAKTEKRKTR